MPALHSWFDENEDVAHKVHAAGCLVPKQLANPLYGFVLVRIPPVASGLVPDVDFPSIPGIPLPIDVLDSGAGLQSKPRHPASGEAPWQRFVSGAS